MKQFIALLLILASVSGCAHVVSEELRRQADQGIPMESLFLNPESYRGAVVILGGTVAHSTNTKEGTLIEVVQKPLDYRGRPERTDRSLGRFLVFHEGFLDGAIYVRGREITVAGEVLGKKVQPLGEIDYAYVLIRNIELHLVEPGRGLPVHIGIGVSGSF